MLIDIASISLDVQNFRHKQVSTERDAMSFLLADEKVHKVTELAKDIVDQGGLDPSSLLIVTSDPNHVGQYIALEGNRRITALKTLMTPDLAKGKFGHDQFKALHSKFLELRITAVECVVLDRAQAAIWIKRKHYKGMGGAGVVAWNAVATSRSDASEGTFSRWMTALAYLEDHGIDAEELRDSISAKTTTVERVLASSHMSGVLGLGFSKDGKVTPENGDEAGAAQLIQSLFESMSERSFIETNVSNAKQQLIFIAAFEAMSVKKPTPASSSVSKTSASDPAENSGSGTSSAKYSSRLTGGNQVAGISHATGAVLRSKSAKTRKVLAAPGLRISNHPLNKFYSELRKLNVENNPHIAAAIIRIFVEKSSGVFLESMNVPTLNTQPGSTWHEYSVKLKDKVGAVLKIIDPLGKSAKLSHARDVANGNRDKTHTVDHLNQAIHSHHALPAHTEIITIWDRFHPYLSDLFEMLENHPKP
jgi:hypothetical protein